ncbi:MAG: sialidase family protein [Gemmatimonadota bacterium]
MAQQGAADPGWKEHLLRRGDGRGGWVLERAEYRFVHLDDYATFDRFFPFGIAALDDGELALIGSAERQRPSPPGTEMVPVIRFSGDGGDSWGPVSAIAPDQRLSRPMGLAALPDGGLTFKTYSHDAGRNVRFVSRDRGRTWEKPIPEALCGEGRVLGMEGNPLVEADADGTVLTELSCWVPPGWPQEPTREYFVRTRDLGRTWGEERRPPEWVWQEQHGGRAYTRSVSEGSLVRAANGWLVAALRTDMPPRYFDGPHDDSLEGTGVSVSRDDGHTWSPIQTLFEAGRHHAHLLRLPDGRLLMTLIVRADAHGGGLASYRRGCDAVVSRDCGLTWEVEERWALDEFEYCGTRYGGTDLFWVNGMTGHLYSALLPDGRVLTTYAHYLSRGGVLIRWRPTP